MKLFLFMTVSASLLIISALLLRPLTDRILHRRIQMILWLAAALRLLLPLRIVSPVSFLSFVRLSGQVSSSGETPRVPLYAEIPVKLPETAITETPPAEIPVISTNAAPSAQEILFLIWFAGVVLTAVVMIILHGCNLYRCRNKTQDRAAQKLVRGCGTVYRCPAAETPFVYGLLCPRIILPENVSGDDLTAVLAHETAHIKGFDILKKYIFAAALCVNWFNPLVWLLMYFSARDMEILCDARALRSPGAPNIKAYAHALLNTAERRAAFNLYFTSHTEVRIMKILKKEKHNRFMLILSVLLVILLVTACTTVPAEKNDTPPETAGTSVESTTETVEKSDEKATEEPVDATAEAESADKNFFVSNDNYWFGGLKPGMNWEEAKPVIAQLSGIEDPVLIVPEVGERSYIDFAFTLFEYAGTVSVDFHNDKIQRIAFDLPLESEAAVEFAHYTIFTRLQKLLGDPDDPTPTLFESWSGSKGSWLVLYMLPIGESLEEKYAVQLQVSGDETEYVDQTVTESEHSNDGELYEDTTIDTEEEAYAELEELNAEMEQLHAEMEQLEWKKEYIAAWLNDRESEISVETAYIKAAQEFLGDDATDSEIREEIAWLKAQDALGLINRFLPDTEGKECVRLDIKHAETDEVLSSHVVPKEYYMDYLSKLKRETAEADVYVSFTLLQ